MTLLEQLEQLEAVAARAGRGGLTDAERGAVLGRKGKLAAAQAALAAAPAEQRKEFGKRLQAVRAILMQAAGAAGANDVRAREAAEAFERDLPARRQHAGTLHPLRTLTQRIEDIFLSMGYEVLDGPEIETAKYNFDLLNIPDNHPARDEWDTFYVEPVGNAKGSATPLLRTHISPMQLRVMEERRPPVRFISPGRVFRHEATDASHEANYTYCEGLAIDEGLTMGDLLGTLDEFFRALFGPDIETRVQPSFFPFVEPGAELLMKGEHGWVEMLGCGMVHPTVLENMHVDPKRYSGFAFGMGIDRLLRSYSGIPDVRLPYQGQLSFLEQF